MLVKSSMKNLGKHRSAGEGEEEERVGAYCRCVCASGEVWAFTYKTLHTKDVYI